MRFIKVRYIGYCGNGDSESISKEDVEKAFPEADYGVYNYKTGSYEGDGDLIVKQNGKFYHSSLGHCSCHGPTDNLDNSNAFDGVDALLKNCSEELTSGMGPIIKKIKKLEGIE